MMEQQNDLYKRALHASEIAQALFYAFIENTWTYDMKNVRIVCDQDEKLIQINIAAGQAVLEGPGTDSTCERLAGGWLISFPGSTFEDGDKGAKHAILADLNSIWAFVVMSLVVKVLFQDLVNDIDEEVREVVHWTPHHIRRLVEHQNFDESTQVDRADLMYPDCTSQGNLKGVYLITLKDGIEVVLDLAGAQFNMHHSPMVVLSTYLKLWSPAIKYSVPFRSHHVKHTEMMNNYRCVTHLTVIIELLACFNKTLVGCDVNKLLSSTVSSIRADGLSLLLSQIQNSMLQHCLALDHGVYNDGVDRKVDIRHPNYDKNLLMDPFRIHKNRLPQSLLLDIGPAKDFSWDKLRQFIMMRGPDVKYKDKKAAKKLLLNRCMYKIPDSYNVVFLRDTLPSSKVPDEYISVNPYYQAR